jgi:predicted nucleic acid-binding protein
VTALVDTGALLAILDRDDVWHARCVAAFETVRLPLLTSVAVLTELFHLVGPKRRDVAAAWQLVRSGALVIGAIADDELVSLERLMERYHDCPMDFADATLVHLAERESISTILTVDVNDFETYRLPRRKRFTVIPGP